MPSTADGQWLVDTAPLWALAQVGLLPLLLSSAPGRLHVTPAVLDDLNRNLDENPFLGDVIAAVASGKIDLVTLTPAEMQRTFDLHSTLWQRSARDSNDLGEAECIAVASHRGWSVITDDRQAKFAMEYRWSHLDCVLTAEVVLGFVDGGYFDMERGWTYLEAMGDAVTQRPKSEWTSRRGLRSVRIGPRLLPGA